MNTITKEFTKEQLIAEARANIATMAATLSNGITDSPRRVARNLRLNEIALASLEAEAAGVVRALVTIKGGFIRYETYFVSDLPDGDYELYTAPPAPVVPDEAISLAVDGIMSTYAENHDECRKRIRNHIEDACRAAMQGALQQEETVKPKK
ncbi:hypothetical protein [Enterobacter cloacae]|uniref:hypothetical protein n=1 Tax=Enterobacter cloacae TaxID=550 RepID=UPI003F4766D6